MLYCKSALQVASILIRIHPIKPLFYKKLKSNVIQGGSKGPVHIHSLGGTRDCVTLITTFLQPVVPWTMSSCVLTGAQGLLNYSVH
jgi:hypothetical protein